MPHSRLRPSPLTHNARSWIALLLWSLCFTISSKNALAFEWNDLPNVVLILSDDQGWNDYGFMGHPHIQTPNLDRLARESLVFSRGYVPTSLCRPSLASIITGLYPHQHGLVGNDPPLPDSLQGKTGNHSTNPEYLKVREAFCAKIDRLDTLPKLLSSQGFQSMQAGKWWEGSFARGGFTHGMTHGDMLRGARHGDEGLLIGRQGLEAIDGFLQQRDAQSPFFLWYAPMMPHTPHNPPAKFLSRYESRAPSPAIAKYWAMCEWFDETIGDLRQLLEHHRVADNTMILYLCDNGWINDPQASRFAPRSKRSPYEGGVRTPIMVHWPRRVAPRHETTQLASSLDLVPTILAATGYPQPPALPGVDLLDQQATSSRKSLQGEIFEHDVVAMDDPKQSLLSRWIIEERWKLILPNPDRNSQEAVELFDLIADPAESHNQANEHPAIVERLRSRLSDAWNE